MNSAICVKGNAAAQDAQHPCRHGTCQLLGNGALKVERARVRASAPQHAMLRVSLASELAGHCMQGSACQRTLSPRTGWSRHTTGRGGACAARATQCTLRPEPAGSLGATLIGAFLAVYTTRHTYEKTHMRVWVMQRNRHLHKQPPAHWHILVSAPQGAGRAAPPPEAPCLHQAGQHKHVPW